VAGAADGSTGSALRVAILGAGAIGAFYGAGMADGGADVTLVARGGRLAAFRDRGLTIQEPERQRTLHLRSTDVPAEIGPVDVVLFCVKSYDTDVAAALLAPLLLDGTAVISLQNGVDNEERIAAAIGWDHVLGGSAYILASVPEPGVVIADGPRGIVFGEWQGGEPTPRVERILEVCARGGIPAQAARDIQAAKWEKFTLLAPFAAMAAGVRLGIGEIREAPSTREMLHALMTEVWRVGRASGVALDDDLVERQFALLTGQNPGATASQYHDLVSGHRMELEALEGTVIRLGRDNGVPTPWMDAAYAILEPWARRNALPEADRAAVP
jgi:2-dehydropantoate 2-reductase